MVPCIVADLRKDVQSCWDVDLEDTIVLYMTSQLLYRASPREGVRLQKRSQAGQELLLLLFGRRPRRLY